MVLNLLLVGIGGCPAFGTILEDDSCLTGVGDSVFTVFLGAPGQRSKGASITRFGRFLLVDNLVFMFGTL
ncbi:hypothetical protein RchiOBHm_Chr1g0341511 [Rosa chinensis]|uniref:Secreted protein n=1 Tax=Rosa chinensis TaxID=74649 RepID=A0A2P6SDR2_ROSCH|nr:hypothetical protein RchiOBHm_Chr1g0341511 [Rosa chinensis]